MFPIHKQFISGNHEAIKIPIEFLILHYTGTGLLQTQVIFKNSKSKVSCHLIVNTDGQIFEMVPCMGNSCFKAWHAGESTWTNHNHVWKGFNDFSIGIELVNKNGNLFSYTSKQYEALSFLLNKLKKTYPALQNPQRILGHEHIAGHRGKVDPGHQFDWKLFFQMNYTNTERSIVQTLLEKLKPNLSLKNLEMFSHISHQFTQRNQSTDEDWIKISQQMEQQCLKDQFSANKSETF